MPLVRLAPVLVLIAALPLGVRRAGAAPVTPSATWYEFAHYSGGTAGCQPADPLGSLCVSATVDPSQPAPAPRGPSLRPPRASC